ncbi:MAG TPA: hypothetical protein VGK93_10780 [Candidatus Eisenbacteria bacterium]
MSIAPLHGRPAPLLFSARQETKWPRYSPTELKSAPLSTRARRVRRQRLERIAWSATIAAIILVGLAAIWLLLVSTPK